MTSLDLWPIGNCQVSALVDNAAGLVWGCQPRVDGDPLFCSLLEPKDEVRGEWRVSLEGQVLAEPRYLKNTPILVTRLTDAEGGIAEVYDFCPRFDRSGRMYRPVAFLRIVRPVAGAPRIRVDLSPATGWGAKAAERTSGTNHIRYLLKPLSRQLKVEETAPGERLEREDAALLARRAFRRYGVDPNAFELRDAFSFQQPNRRDWLFHFEKREPLVADAIHRVSVRVMGTDVTQFVNTIRIPESVYREATQQTLVSIVLLVLKLGGIVIGLALVVAGAILTTRHGGVAWRRAGRLTAVLAVIPIATTAVHTDRFLFGYDTTTAWETYTVNVVTNIVRTAGVQILILFLALAGILSIYPYATRLVRGEGRALLGRAAALAAITAIALFVIFDETVRWIERAIPSIAHAADLAIPAAVGLPVPSLFETGEALFGAIVLSGAVALYASVVSRWRRQWVAAVVTSLIVFCLSIDTSVSVRELPLALGAAAILAVLVWIIARYILGSNLLAWPAAAFVASLLQSAAALLQNDRADLLLHGSILIIVASATLLWLATRSPRPSRPDVRSDRHERPAPSSP